MDMQNEPKDQAKVLIAMSGGVDSATVCAIIAKSGVECCGGTMKLFDSQLLGRPITSGCCSIEDIDDAKDVCHKLGVNHYTINCKRQFIEHVVDPFVLAYINGTTPNPCIACNRYLKFDTLLKKAEMMGFDCVATGHYARIKRKGSRYQLLRGVDEKKDQSYVLHTLTQDQLARTIFPLGELTKNQVRQLAKDCGLIVAEKSESQDICFVEDGSVDKFIAHYTKGKVISKQEKTGTIEDVEGNVIGHYDPQSQHFTIGQRKGLGVSLGFPAYVADIDVESSRVVLGGKDDLLKERVQASDFNWISISPKIGSKISCSAKIRYNMKDVRAKVKVEDENRVTVVFRDGVSAPAKGQSIVVYDGDVVLGGGYIESSE